MVRQRPLPCTTEVKLMNDARDFLAGRSETELSAIARAAGTSLCHLRNICYGQKRAGPNWPPASSAPRPARCRAAACAPICGARPPPRPTPALGTAMGYFETLPPGQAGASPRGNST